MLHGPAKAVTEDWEKCHEKPQQRRKTKDISGGAIQGEPEVRKTSNYQRNEQIFFLTVEQLLLIVPSASVLSHHESI